MQIKLGFGKQQIEVEIPGRNLLGILKPNEVAVDLMGAEEVRRAMGEPIGSPKLSQIVRKGEKVVIITSDITRPMPSRIVLPEVIGELLQAGCAKEDITIVLALGSHRAHTEEEKKYFHELMAPAGLLEEQDEWTMKCAGGVMGCGPAFAAMFVEALSDGAVACGLPRKEAFRYAAEMLKGTADVILQTGKHPGEVKDSVCSPAGSTIQGVRVLEERNFRAAVMDAVIATFEKKF